MSLNLAYPARRTPGAACTCGCATRIRRYPCDTTDAEWAALAALLPAPLSLTELGGRPEKHHRRAVIDAVFYLVDNGIKWRALPADFPPWQTVYALMRRWTDDGATGDLVDTLRGAVRIALGRDRVPSAGCIDSQSVHKSAEGIVSRDTSGFDHYKKVNGRKRHIVTDTLGLLVSVLVSPASAQDRDAAWKPLYWASRRGIRRVWADHGYEGPLTDHCEDLLGLVIEVVHRPRDKPVGFQVLPRRWVVERSFAWISRRRRCARDYERLPRQHITMVRWAAILQMTRRLARISQV